LEDISPRFNQKSKLDRWYKVAHNVMLVGLMVLLLHSAAAQVGPLLGVEAAARTTLEALRVGGAR
jgi:hypothetical protein